MKFAIKVFCLLATCWIAYGNCKPMDSERNKVKATELYKEAKKLYAENKYKQSYWKLKEALRYYDTDKDYVEIKYRCFHFVPGAFVPIKRSYETIKKAEYNVNELIREIKERYYPKLRVAVFISDYFIRIVVRNTGSERDTLPADGVKVVVVDVFGNSREDKLGDIEAGKEKSSTLPYIPIKRVLVKERYSFNPLAIEIE